MSSVHYFAIWLLSGYLGTLGALFVFRKRVILDNPEIILATLAPLTGPVVLVLFVSDTIRKTMWDRKHPSKKGV